MTLLEIIACLILGMGLVFFMGFSLCVLIRGKNREYDEELEKLFKEL